MEPTVDLIWNECLSIIRDNVPQRSFRTWFEPILPLSFSDAKLTIQVPSQFFFEWLEEHYLDLMHRTLKRVIGPEATLEYSILMEAATVANHSPAVITMPGTKGIHVRNPETVMPVTLSGSSIKNPFIIPGLRKISIPSQLILSLTFECFVEGDCNRLARAAGIAVAENPGGTSFNPLLLYGGVGMGKTHLAHAVGNAIMQRFPEKKTVLYVSSEKFSNQFSDAIQRKEVNDFVHFYQAVDVLIVDDVQFFANKEKTQEAFFNIFNHLHQSGKQIILTSDRPPVELKGLQDRLLSRFKWGLAADLQSPDLDTRMAILRQKMYRNGLTLPEEVVEFIATNVSTNVRELEGAMISIIAHANLNRGSIDLDVAKRVMKHFVKQVAEELTIESIVRAVSDYYQVAVPELKGKSRKREIVQARQIAMFFAKQLTAHTLKSIGENFGNRDHSTVLHSFHTVSDLMDTDRKYRLQVEELQKRIKMRTSL